MVQAYNNTGFICFENINNKNQQNYPSSLLNSNVKHGFGINKEMSFDFRQHFIRLCTTDTADQTILQMKPFSTLNHLGVFKPSDGELFTTNTRINLKYHLMIRVNKELAKNKGSDTIRPFLRTLAECNDLLLAQNLRIHDSADRHAIKGHQIIIEQVISQWTDKPTGQRYAQKFNGVPDIRAFVSLLKKISSLKNKPLQLKARVQAILKEFEFNAELRAKCIASAKQATSTCLGGAPHLCPDCALSSIKDIEAEILTYYALRGKYSGKELLEFGKKAYRRSVVEKGISSFGRTRLTKKDIQPLKTKLKNLENGPEMCDFLVRKDAPWGEYLIRAHPEVFETAFKDLTIQLSRLNEKYSCDEYDDAYRKEIAAIGNARNAIEFIVKHNLTRDYLDGRRSFTETLAGRVTDSVSWFFEKSATAMGL